MSGLDVYKMNSLQTLYLQASQLQTRAFYFGIRWSPTQVSYIAHKLSSPCTWLHFEWPRPAGTSSAPMPNIQSTTLPHPSSRESAHIFLFQIPCFCSTSSFFLSLFPSSPASTLFPLPHALLTVQGKLWYQSFARIILSWSTLWELLQLINYFVAGQHHHYLPIFGNHHYHTMFMLTLSTEEGNSTIT